MRISAVAGLITWAPQALDVLLEKMRNAGFDFSRVKAVSGSGQVTSAFIYCYLLLSCKVFTFHRAEMKWGTSLFHTDKWQINVSCMYNIRIQYQTFGRTNSKKIIFCLELLVSVLQNINWSSNFQETQRACLQLV